MKNELKTYEIKIECTNCGYGNFKDLNKYIKIPRGEKVDDRMCPNCGCNTLIKS